jgi:hypothetical protein
MNTGKLRIGDHWNAITIIALSQNNPLKAIAEFVENSIDDGEGIPLDEEGVPDFKYVATRICDSIKKKLKHEGIRGIQGEFGIGLLSLWTAGERLVLSSPGRDGKTYQMEMKKGEQGYAINPRRLLFPHQGTEIFIHPLLPGLKQLTGERIQHYLASELRDRIRKTGVRITIKDRTAKGEYEVKPREFTGRHLGEFDTIETAKGPIYLERYLNTRAPENTVSIFRSGTRVLPSVTTLDFFDRAPWNLGYLQKRHFSRSPGRTTSGSISIRKRENRERLLKTLPSSRGARSAEGSRFQGEARPGERRPGNRRNSTRTRVRSSRRSSPPRPA